MRGAIAAMAILLAACGSEPASDQAPDGDVTRTPAPLQGADARSGDARSRGDQAEPAPAPSRQIALQPISYPEIEANRLYGASCAYGAGESMAALVIARHNSAWIKIGGQLLELAPQEGAAELPYGSHAAYASADYTLVLQIAADAQQLDAEISRASGAISLRNSGGQAVFATTGTVQCGA